MSELDIRSSDKAPVRAIRFGDSSDSIISQAGDDGLVLGGAYVPVEDVNNLIAALRKAVELGWCDEEEEVEDYWKLKRQL